MRKYLASLAFTGCLALAAPVSASPAVEAADASVRSTHQLPTPVQGLRDEVAMVLLGTALIGVAAAVRRRAA